MLSCGKYEHSLGAFLKNLFYLFSRNRNKILPFFMLIEFILETLHIHIKWDGI